MRRRFQQTCSLFLCTLVAVSLPGCKDLKEVDDISMIVAVGIDEADDHQVQVSGQIVDPLAARSPGKRSGGGGEKAFTVHSEYGSTVEEAINKFDEHLPRKTFLSHNSVVVFGQTYAEHGIGRALDYIERNRDFRRNELLVVASDRAVRVLSVPTSPEPLNAVALRSLVEHGEEKSVTIDSTQLAFMRQYLSPSHVPLLARVDVNSEDELGQYGLGVLDGGKLADCLSPEEANALLLFLGPTQQHAITLPCDHRQTSDLGMTVRILSTQTKVRPVVRGHQIGFNVQVRGQAEIERLCPTDKPTPDMYRAVELKVQHNIEARMHHVLSREKSKHLDAMQFGTALFQAYPAVWHRVAQRWNNLLPAVPVHLDVKIHVFRSGLTSKAPDAEYTREGLAPRAGRDEKSR